MLCIVDAILKNVKGASISSANKAVSGWLKHAKERYERHIIINDRQIDNSQDLILFIVYYIFFLCDQLNHLF